MNDTTLQKSRESKIHDAADDLAREVQKLILHTSGSIGEFVEACRPDVAGELDRFARDRDCDHEAECDAVLDAMGEFGEAIMRVLEPRFTRVLKHMFIDAANELAAQVPPIAVRDEPPPN